ncbi:MAG: MBL fold metallo-hydrolase [Hyphomicrobiaceae bacterium]
MKLTLVGCGDAFGSGGRLNTCFHVSDGAGTFLIDCGASSMIGLNRLGLDPNAIDTVLISHLHGDHFAGLVFFLLHAQHVARRTVPLDIVGPPGIEARVVAASEALFPGSTTTARRHPLAFREIAAGEPLTLGASRVTAFEVSHPSGAPSHALRIERDGRVLAFSGDTEWVDALTACARGADLFIVECYEPDRAVRYHINWRTLSEKLELLTARRILLTHMNTAMLAARDLVSDPRITLAEDGLVLDV